MAVVARLERDRPVRRGSAGTELPRLGDRPRRELGAADAGRGGTELRGGGARAGGELGAAGAGGEAEVVLDRARGARLAAERGALDDQGVEALGRTVDRGAEPGRAAADDDEVDLLVRSQIEPD